MIVNKEEISRGFDSAIRLCSKIKNIVDKIDLERMCDISDDEEITTTLTKKEWIIVVSILRSEELAKGREIRQSIKDLENLSHEFQCELDSRNNSTENY